MGIIRERLEDLRKNYNTVEVLKFNEFLHTCESTDIIEDFRSTFIEPMKGAQFAKEFVLLNSFNKTDLGTMKVALEGFIQNAELECYTNDEHVECVKEALDVINAKLDHPDTCIADLLIDSMYTQELESVSESAIEDRNILSAILSQDVSDNDKVKLANMLVERIKSGTSELNTSTDITNLMTVTTAVVYSVTTQFPLTVVNILYPIPTLIMTNLIDKGASRDIKKVYVRTFKSELKKIEAAINALTYNEAMLVYKHNLIEAISTLENSTDGINIEATLESVTTDSLSETTRALDFAILENFYNFAFREDETVEESVSWFNNIVALQNIKDIVIQESVGSLSKKDEMTDEEFEDLIDEMDDDTEDDFLDEFLTEATKGDKARKKVNVNAHKLKLSAQKLKDKTKNAGQAAKAAKNHVDKAGKAIDDAATGAVNKAKNVYRDDVRGEIIESKTTVKLGRIIRKGIMIGSLTLVNPALGAIGALTTLALRKSVKAKEKKKILNELQEELEIVNEKIEDSRGDENKEKKYQLMRIKNKLQRDITRIQYNLKAEDKGV